MKFEEFCVQMFELLEQDAVEVSEDTNLRDELNVDSLQMVNLATSLADYYKVPFSSFIVKADELNTVGGLYTIIKENISNESL
jgi:acyl carrier protein